ncbi:MAG: phosphatidate cytidylyltransferase, partial [Dehalococcoidales bacterium]|nr:phosphatidate cytidylyltransferase [Dehalococcoidales bacterium]
MLKKRFLTALCGIPPLVAAVWFGEPWFTILVAVWGGITTLEFYRMVKSARISPLTYFGLIWVLLFIFSPHLTNPLLQPLLLTSAVILPLVWLVLNYRGPRDFASWAWTLAGIFYIGWLLSHWISLRSIDPLA